MRGNFGGLLPAFLVLVFSVLLFSGCVTPPAEEDNFSKNAEALNARIAAASASSEISNLSSEVAALKATAQNDSRYSRYLPLLDAQNLTLQVLGVYMEFKSESATIGTSGIDCSKDYSAFIARLRSANATASSGVSKAQSYLSSEPNSTANLLIAAMNKTSPNSMAAYADILEMEYGRGCLKEMKPAKTYTLPLSGKDALDIAANAAGTDYFVYGFNETLPAGTIVTAPRAMGDQNFTLKGDSWFFFLDSQPWAPFGHDVKYVMIDSSTGGYSVSNETMYPLIDGKAHWSSVDERSDPANILYPEDAADYLTIPVNLSGMNSFLLRTYPLAGPSVANGPNAGKSVNELLCCQAKKRYALIMTGSNDSMFQADTERMYNHLKANGYSDADITYLTGKADAAGSDGVTSVPNLAAALNNISANAKCCDEIFIYLAGHGSQDQVWKYRHKTTGETKWIRRLSDLGGAPADWEYTSQIGYYHKIDVMGGYATSEALADFIDGMESCKITIVYQSCFSGAAASTLAKPGVTVLTPVDSEHSSYGVSGPSGEWGTGSFFSQAYINAKGSANATADTNHDGIVSEKEAFDYADKKNHDEMESRRRKWQEKADAEDNATKKARYQAQADGIQEQIGVYKEGGPCTCCYANCSAQTNWLCTVFDGRNQETCPECKGKKIGDYCGPTVTPPPVNETPLTGNGTGGNVPAGNMSGGNATTGGGAGEQPPGNAGNGTTNESAVCGDGKITGNEGCDYGSTNTNKCQEGYYCHDSCVCKKLETTVVCGDGKISAPNEDCDGGNVKFKLCPSGFTCTLCKCVPTQAQCGDGKVTPPEECDPGNSYTDYCPGGKTCYGCKCYAPDQVPQATHKACSGSYCTVVEGEGPDSCTSDSQCAQATHSVCSGSRCVSVEGEGSDECTSDSQCTQAAPTHKACSGLHCVSVSGAGSDQCSSDAQCIQTPAPYCGDGMVNGNETCDPTASPSGCYDNSVCASNCVCVFPPSLNCAYICSQTSGAQSFGGAYSTSSECINAVKNDYGTKTCYLTCTYAYLYKVTNIAGSATCCCGMKKEFPCSDCPGQNPVCPGNQTCAQNAPSWYQP